MHVKEQGEGTSHSTYVCSELTGCSVLRAARVEHRPRAEPAH